MKRTALALLLASALSGSLTACFPLVLGGAAGTAVVATDRRTSGAYVDDQAIVLKAGDQMNRLLPDAHVNLTSFNRAVLMTGEVQTDEQRQQAEMLVRGIPGVMRVYNYTLVTVPSTFGQRNNDAWITAKVRGRLMSGQGNYSAQSFKVVSERGVVYLFGLVTQAEGDAATAVASQTAGVLKVITLFEYLMPLPQAQQPSQSSYPAPTASQPAAQ
jgi:osmotically-inducible protein OsmY